MVTVLQRLPFCSTAPHPSVRSFISKRLYSIVSVPLQFIIKISIWLRNQMYLFLGIKIPQKPSFIKRNIKQILTTTAIAAGGSLVTYLLSSSKSKTTIEANAFFPVCTAILLLFEVSRHVLKKSAPQTITIPIQSPQEIWEEIAADGEKSFESYMNSHPGEKNKLEHALDYKKKLKEDFDKCISSLSDEDTRTQVENRLIYIEEVIQHLQKEPTI